VTGSKRWMIWGAVVAALLAAHFVFEFTAWASHPGNSAVGRGSSIPWEIASFPLFPLIGQPGRATYFWQIMVLNSLIWSVGLALIAQRIYQRIAASARVSGSSSKSKSR
jgi:hypothetical protein